MDIVWEICLQALELFTLTMGILGALFSLLLIVSPTTMRKFGDICNRMVYLDRKFTRFVDKSINTENLIYRHNMMFGVAFIVSCAFILVFLFYRLDVRSFVTIFFQDGSFRSTGEMIVSAMALIGKITGIVGLLIGSILLYSPEHVKSVEFKLNTWLSTEPVLEQLDRSYHTFDSLVYRRPVLFGSLGLFTSGILTFLAFRNIM